MNADCPFVKFSQIKNLMDRLFKFDLRGKTVGKFKFIRLAKFAVAGRFVDRLNRKVLPFQAADRHGHPATLVIMVMNSRNLASFPTDRHHLKSLVFIDQIAGVTGWAPEQIFTYRFDVHRVLAQEVIDDVANE